MDVQNAAVALVLSIFTQFEIPAQSAENASKFFSELFCCEAVQMAQIGLLHHFGRFDADLLTIGAIFREDLINQCLLLCHSLILPVLNTMLMLCDEAIQKETPA